MRHPRAPVLHGIAIARYCATNTLSGGRACRIATPSSPCYARVMLQDAPEILRAHATSVLRISGCALLLLLSTCKRSSEPGPQHRRELRAQGESGTVVISVPVPKAAPLAPPRLRHAFERECKNLARATCDVRDDPCQTRWFELARCVSGHDAIRPPLRFISKAASRSKRLEHRAQTSGARAALERAARILGLGQGLEDGALAAGSPENGERSERESGLGANAYYAPRERVVFFVADAATPYADESVALTLVHEYVHAIQDRDGELVAVRNARATRTFDQELTAWSAFEGEATLYEEAVRAWIHERDPRTWLLERFAARTSGSEAALARQRRPLEASFATFPYSYGAYWATLEAEPPHSTHQILARRHDWPPATPQRCEDESPPRLAPDHPLRARDTLGAWLVEAYVRRRSSDPERARAAARRWRGDWLSIYSRSQAADPSIIWRTCWDSAQTALEMRDLILAQLRESSGDRALVTAAAHHVTATVRAGDLAELTTSVAARPFL
jgi:hypothetical protein